MSARAVCLALLCLALSGCKPEDPAPFEAEKAKLLAETVPKDEYWKHVERKGTALKAVRGAEQRSARAAAEGAQVSTAIEQLRTAVADAKRVNEQIVVQRDGLDTQMAKLRARRQFLEAYLDRTGPVDVAAPKK